MPRIKGKADTLGKPIAIRLPPDEEAYYRKQSAAHRMSLNAYLTKLLVEGAVAEKAAEFGELMDKKISEFAAMRPTTGGGVPDELMLSIITSEALLASIISVQDPQALYQAQEAARAKLRKMKGAKP